LEYEWNIEARLCKCDMNRIWMEYEWDVTIR
jgi:hypothetical protein